MSEIDLAILCVLFISAALGVLRGLLRELLSLLPWLVALGVTLFYTRQFAVLLPIDSIQSPQARTALSASILFLGILATGLVIKWMFGRAMGASPIKVFDRLTGGMFGLGRGFLIVTVLTLGANLIPEIKQENWWRESKVIPRFQVLAKALHTQLPDSVAQHFDFTPTGY